MAAEEERRRTMDGQETIYSGTAARLNPERKLRITRQVCATHIEQNLKADPFGSCRMARSARKISWGRG